MNFLRNQFIRVFILMFLFFILYTNVLFDSTVKRKSRLSSQSANTTNELINYEIDLEKFTNKVKSSPLIFIGGYARSGTTLMRAILDVHPSIRCGPETKVIPTIIRFVADWKAKSKNLVKDLKNAGVKENTVDNGIANFIYYVLGEHGPKASRLCAKDPDTAYYFKYLHSIFPNAKFIYMIRDGRAAAYSYINKINEKLNFKIYKSYLNTWNQFNRIAGKQCTEIGPKFCIMVKYEDLVLHPNKTLKNILKFLDEPWTDELLKHQNYVGEKISVSKTEWSTDEIVKPINTKSLTAWVGKIQIDKSSIKHILLTLERLGYSPDENNLNYGENQADSVVQENNKLISEKMNYWKERAKNITDDNGN